MKRLADILLFVLAGLIIYDFAPIKYVNKDIKPYYNEVISLVKTTCSNKQYRHPLQVIIRFGNLNEDHSGLIGYCESRLGYSIVFDEKFWKKSNNDLKFELVAHEMTHCLFRLGHSDDPRHYMYYGLNSHNILTKSETIEQLTEVIKEQCSK